MLSCWYCNPEKRPKFSDLEKIISKILGKTKSDHYIYLNEPYLEANERRFNSGETDYVALLSSPDYEAPRAPVNDLQENYFEPSAELPVGVSTATNIAPKTLKICFVNNVLEIPLPDTSHGN